MRGSNINQNLLIRKVKMVLLDILEQVEDDRSYHGREYKLHYILLFTILALLDGAITYIDIHRFIKKHFTELKDIFKLKWRQVPGSDAIRKILVRTDPEEVEKAFREYSTYISKEDNSRRHICFDGKSLNGSFSKCKDKRAMRVFNVFSKHSEIVLAHIPLKEDKDHEIPALQKFIQELDLKGVVVTADALHCQKKHLN
jgi:hypothetical protein